MDAVSQKIIAHHHVDRESFNEALTWFVSLRSEGLNPEFMTIDGERSITRAVRVAWPTVRLQRCLYHIQHEGMRWLRTHPKTQAGRDLRTILSRLSCIKTPEERDSFVNAYHSWLYNHKEFVRLLPSTVIAFKDLRRTMVLINNALPDMFHYIGNECVHSTTNALEGFHSRLKADYRRHRGLTRTHRKQYIDWYCHLKNRRLPTFS
jgi:transposase-like protein